MAEKAKVAKVTEREIVKDVLVAVLTEKGANLVGLTKEGKNLVLEVNGKHVVVRAILKKENLEAKDIVKLG
jgi:hypothetical protein